MQAKKNRLGVSEAASLHAVQGGRNRAGDQGGKPRGLMCSSATLAGFFDLSDASGPPWALLDLLLLFLDVLLLLVLLLVALHLADGRADLPLHALDAQLALVRQVVEVGVLLHRGQRRGGSSSAPYACIVLPSWRRWDWRPSTRPAFGN